MTILIVEDHEGFRRSLRHLLELSYPRHRISEAATGEESVSLAQVSPPDLVIMDISLPGMSGIEATTIIKRALPEVPVVILSVHDGRVFREKASGAGASAYVLKSRTGTELMPVLIPFLGASANSRVCCT